MKPLPLALLALTALLTACGGASTPQELLDSAQSALNAGEYEQAAADAAAAAAGAGEAGDDALAWRAQSIELFALGRQGKGDEVLAGLKAAEAKWADKVDDKFLTRLITELDKGGDLKGSTDVLAHGIKRFPDRKDQFDKFGAMLAEKAAKAAAAGEGGDALKQLEQLGYLGG